MDAEKGGEVDEAEERVSMIEIEEERMGFYLVAVSDDDSQFVKIDLSELIDIDIALKAVLLIANQQPDHDVW